MRLEARRLFYSYHVAGRQVLTGLDASFAAGSYWCIGGPNGSGKSTFLRLAACLLPLGNLDGELAWDGRHVRDWTRLELARSLAFVGGGLRTHFPMRVENFVLQGRYAYSRSFWARPTEEDRELAFESLGRVGVATLAEASTAELSAGESQLVLIARALAQQPRALILDEATANLDLRHQFRIFELLGQLNRQGLTVLVVSHDLNLASEFCPNALWLKDGATYSQGTLEETLTPELMQALYDVGSSVAIGRNPSTDRPKIFRRFT